MPRNSCLKDKILQVFPDSSKHKPKDICRTRWVQRIEGMDVFQELFVPVYHFLLTVKENNDIFHYNNETSAKAEPYWNIDFEFIIAW